MDLELRHLKMMVALVNTGNMTRAADELHLTQSALSHQLKDAEEKLGAPLFVRQNKKLILTPAGKEFADLSKETLHRLRASVCAIREAATVEQRSLKIKTACYTSFSWLPGAVNAYSEIFPKVKIELSASCIHPVQELRSGKYDVAILYYDVNSPDLHIETLFTDQLMLIMSPSHKLAKKQHISPKELDGENIVIYNVPDRESTLINGIMKPAGAKPGRVTRIELTEGILELVKTGHGIGILADWAVRDAVDKGQLVAKEITSKVAKRTWSMAALKKNLAPHIKEFFEIARCEVQSHAHFS